jgi:predicted RNase H-like HicB family nuclease
MATRHFTAIIEGSDEPGYSVFFPDLPGCVSAGDTVEEAALNAREALDLHVRGMIEDGGALPTPSSPDRIPSDPEVREVARMLVPVDLPGRAIRLNISLEESLVDAIDRAAAARGTSRSGFLAAAAQRALREDA